MIVFDIETGPLPEDRLREQFTPPPLPPEPEDFDPSAVKLGNLKDAAKINERIEAARAAHEAAKAGHAADYERAEDNAWREFVSQAPLSALTGRVLAIGYRSEKATIITHLEADAIGSEEKLIELFWGRFLAAKKDRRSLVGHNIAGFDIPFLIRRSWLLGIDVPTGLFDANWRYLDRAFIDTMQRWQAGNYRDKFAGLDTLGRAMGIGGKTEGMDGGDFHRMYWGSQDERAKAFEYLIRDLELTWMVAQRLGVV